MVVKKGKWLRDLMNPFDRLRYLLWRVSGSKKHLIVTMRDGKKLAIRPLPTTDLATAYEIFIDQAYHKPSQVPEPSPEFIVDIGANVGYSVLHWAYTYPSAQLLAFEPHPAHLLMLYRHLEINGIRERVRVIESAVSNTSYQSFLTDQENESVVVDKYEPGRLPIKVCDLFTEILGKRIDLFKMDIEGGEYAILQDERFDKLDVRMMVLEWHNTDEIPNGQQWCSDRLSALGFTIAEGEIKYANAGIMWAWK